MGPWIRGQTAVATLLAAGTMAGCSSLPDLPPPQVQSAPPVTGSLAPQQPGPSVTLSPQERALDCRRLTGRMQVRILQIRDRLGTEPNPAYAALRTFMRSFETNRPETPNVDAITQQDVALLHAYNDELGRKRCPQFDLADELRPKPLHETPRPRLQPTAKAAR